MSATDTACVVELTPMGFVVTYEGRAMPKSANVLVFAARFRAEQLAEAIDAGDMDSAHEIIQHGRWIT